MKNKLIIFLTCLLVPSIVFCSHATKPAGIGYVAQSIMEPVSILSEFVTTASMVIGISFLFGALFRYMQHRVNPLAAPISTVLLLLFLGAMLILLPYSHKLMTMAGG